MERLYAAVMRQDERRSPQVGPPSPELPRGAPPEYSRTNPPRLITDAPALRHLQVQVPDQYSQYPRSPMTPKSPVRAIYPPDSPMPVMPSSPTSPIRAEYPTTPLAAHYPQQSNSQSSSQDFYEHRPASFSSNRSTSSKGKARKLRRLKISSPVPVLDDNSDGARTPLSPRCYIDPGIPPEPPTARTVDSQYPPTTAGTGASWRFGDEYKRRLRRERTNRPSPRPTPTTSEPDGELRQRPTVTARAHQHLAPPKTTPATSRERQQYAPIPTTASRATAKTAHTTVRPEPRSLRASTWPTRALDQSASRLRRSGQDDFSGSGSTGAVFGHAAYGHGDAVFAVHAVYAFDARHATTDESGGAQAAHEGR